MTEQSAVSSERKYYQTSQQDSSQGEYNQTGQEYRKFLFDYSVRYTKNLVQTGALVFGLASLLAAHHFVILYLYLTICYHHVYLSLIYSQDRRLAASNL